MLEQKSRHVKAAVLSAFRLVVPRVHCPVERCIARTVPRIYVRIVLNQRASNPEEP